MALIPSAANRRVNVVPTVAGMSVLDVRGVNEHRVER